MARHSTPPLDAAKDELVGLYAEADRLVAGGRCVCTDAVDAAGAFCCHFANIGREPYVTEIELAWVTRAIAARGGLPGDRGRDPRRRRLPLAAGTPGADDLRTCALLSRSGRCTIYEARPLGCRTFFCEGHGPDARGPTRKALQAIARRIADLSDRVFPRSGGPRPLSRALASLAGPRAR